MVKLLSEDIPHFSTWNKCINKCYRKIKRNGIEFSTVFDPYSGKESSLLNIQGRIVLNKNEVEEVILKDRSATKRAGARKLYHRIKLKFVAVHENTIQALINKDPHQKPQFHNKAKLKSQVMERIQVDIVELGMEM